MDAQKDLMKDVTFVLLWIPLFFYTHAFSQDSILKIAFGSCSNQNHPLPVLDVIANDSPDVFIFLGDNVYGDTDNMDTLKSIYQRLRVKPGFQRLNRTSKILATWDDHDYGWNDIGRHWKYRQESKKIFLDFFSEPLDSERWKHEGIYTSYLFNAGSKKVQVILLDTRTFRDNLRKAKLRLSRNFKYFHSYKPYKKNDSTLLGAEQWAWLEQELKKPADIRLICSSIQFGIEANGYECWANFPHEQKKMFELIKSSKADGVVFLSGDVHYGEISKIECKGLYPVYDITSSGLSSTWDFATPNKNRIGKPVMANNFGLITIDETDEIKIELRDTVNRVTNSIGINYKELKISGR